METNRTNENQFEHTPKDNNKISEKGVDTNSQVNHNISNYNKNIIHESKTKTACEQKDDFDSIISGNEVDLGSARKPLDLLGAIHRYARIVILLGSLCFLCLIPLAIIASSPYYMATGSILVERVRAPIIASTEQRPISNFFYDYAQTEVHRLGNINVLRKTLESLPIDAQKVFAPFGVTEGAVLALRKSLTIGLIPNTHLIMVQMRTNVPNFATDIVNTLMQSYIKHTAHMSENRDQRRIEYLENEYKNLQIKEENLTNKLMSLANKTRTATFVEAYNVDSLRLIELQKSLTIACREMIESRNHLLSVENKAKAIRALSTEALSDELVAGDESLWSISYWTYKTLQEMRASIDGVSRTNPDRQYIELRMEAMKAYEAQLKKSVTERAQRIVHDKREYDLDKEILTAKSTAFASKKSYDELKSTLHKMQAVAATNSRSIIEGQIVEANLAQTRDRLYALETRLQELRAESKSPVRASVEEFAPSSENPAGTNLKKFIMLSGFLSFGGVGCIFLTMELLDNRIRSKRDLVAATEHAPSWPLPLWSGESPLWQVTATHVSSEAAKSMRSLAVRLHKERSRSGLCGAQAVVFTGVSSKVGTTSIAVNVARALAGLGEKVLYIEATNKISTDSKENTTIVFTKKEINSDIKRDITSTNYDSYMCKLDGDNPLQCVFRPKNEFFDCIHIGSDWGNGHDGALSQVLKVLSSEYSYILIDTHPLIESDLTEYLLLEAHVAVVVAQAQRTQYSDMRKNLEILWRLHVPAMTLILNHGGPQDFTKAELLLKKIPTKILQYLMPHLLQDNGREHENLQIKSMWKV